MVLVGGGGGVWGTVPGWQPFIYVITFNSHIQDRVFSCGSDLVIGDIKMIITTLIYIFINFTVSGLRIVLRSDASVGSFLSADST